MENNENKKVTIIKDIFLVFLSIVLSVISVIVAFNIGLIKAPKNGQETPSETSFTKAIEKARQSSVAVICDYESTNASAGSGVIISYDKSTKTAFAITNHHVISGVAADKFEIIPNGYATNERVRATLVGTDPENDIAILSFQPKIGKPLPVVCEIGRSLDNLVVGETVFAVGNPRGFYDSVCEGIVSTIGRYLDVNGIYKAYIQTTAPINPGNSGGGLFDANGKLIGINTLSLSNTQSMSFSLPMLFDESISRTNKNYDAQKRDALTSFNILKAKHEQLVASGSANTVGYIEGQKSVGALFETFTIVEKVGIEKQLINNVYVEGIFDFLPTVSTSPNVWSEPKQISGSQLAIDFVEKVEVKTEADVDYKTASIITFDEKGKLKEIELVHDTTSSDKPKHFTACDLYSFLSKQKVDTQIRFTIRTNVLDDSSDSLTKGTTTKQVIAKIQNFVYETPTN